LEINKNALPLHPLSPLKRRMFRRFLEKGKIKKVTEIFGGLKYLPYLCTTFRSKKIRV
jgi:hypothetical protein